MLERRACAPRKSTRGGFGSSLASSADRDYDALAVKYVRLYTDNDGQSRFEDLDFTFAQQEFAPPAPPLDVSEPLEASAVMMLRAPAGWTDPMHPTPARQFMFILAGKWEVTAGGETRTLSAGDVVLGEDTTGSGHASSVIEDTVLAVVRL
jgi:quercetin dioxygenase-like cupin family protein